MRDMMVTNGFSADQVEVLPPIPMGLEQEPSSLDTEPIVLFVGQVIRGKGVDLLLRALAEVRQPFRALIVGTGNHMQACVELARKLKLGGQVSFLGWVSHDRIGDYFGRARVVAVPSRWPEPFGMVGLEAMWASRPVVAFAVGGIPDWLADGESGFAVPEQDWKLYGQAIEQLLEEPQLAARIRSTVPRRCCGGQSKANNATATLHFEPGAQPTAPPKPKKQPPDASNATGDGTEALEAEA
jgi:glycosyltransferase involved in cell wall biosynthesis